MSLCSEGELKRLRYLTTYKSHYPTKQGKGLFRGSTKQEFKDPIAETFKRYLDIENQDIKPPNEDADIYLEKVRNEYPKVGTIHFPTPLDHCVIKKHNLYQGKTTYQVDYCNIEEDMRRKILEIENKKVNLPPDWVIPLTTHTYDYREPVEVSSHAYDPNPIIKPVNNLDPNAKINEILKIRTGNSEYMARIGTLGEFIVVNQMHGKIAR